MIAHREARRIAFNAEEKFRTLDELLARHAGRRTLIFTDDTAMVYRVADEYLLPAITHHTPVKERHATLARFRDGRYPVIVSSRVLNEGVDVPEAGVAIVLVRHGHAARIHPTPGPHPAPAGRQARGPLRDHRRGHRRGRRFASAA